jgi:hypothetical protein
MLEALSVRGGCFALLAALLPLLNGQAPQTEWTLERARKEWKPMTRGLQHVTVAVAGNSALVDETGRAYLG